jgi:hypothetical protein
MAAARLQTSFLGVVAALLSAALAAGGCGTTPLEAEDPAQTETPPLASRTALPPPQLRSLPPLRQVRVEPAQLSLPAGWIVSTNPREPEPEFIEFLERVRSADSAALGRIDESLAPDSQQALVAFDPLLEGQYMTRVRLGVVPREPGFEGALETWSERWLELIASTPTLFGPLESERLELPAGPAFRITYRDRSYEDVPLVGDDYYLVRGDRAYVLAFEGANEGLLPLFRAIAETLELTP